MKQETIQDLRALDSLLISTTSPVDISVPSYDAVTEVAVQFCFVR